MTKPNEHYQFDLLYVPHNVFEGNTHKYILTGFDFASRCKVARARLQYIGSVIYLNIQKDFNVIMGLILQVM